jgi:hypothetical protein
MRRYSFFLLAAAITLASCSSSPSDGRQSAYGTPPSGPGSGPGDGGQGGGPGGSAGSPPPAPPSEASRSGSMATVRPQAPSEEHRSRSTYTWTQEGSSGRAALAVKDATVVYGMEGDAAGPLMINLLFANQSDRGVEILWSECTLSSGSGSAKLALGMPPSTMAEGPNAVVPAKGSYAQSVAPADALASNPESGSPFLHFMPRGVLRLRIIYRTLPNGLPSAFSLVLTPTEER